MRLLPLALAGLLVERVIYKVNSFQFTRSARLVLALPEERKVRGPLRYLLRDIATVVDEALEEVGIKFPGLKIRISHDFRL